MSACGDPDHSSASSPARQAQHLPSPSAGTLQPAPAWGHPNPPPPGITACWAPHRESCWPRGTPCRSPTGWSQGPPPAEGPAQRQSLSWQRCWVSSAAPPARIPAPAEGYSGKPRRQVTPQGATQAIAPHQAVYEQGACCTHAAYFGGLFSNPNTDNYQQAVISHPTPALPQPWKEVWHAEHRVLVLPAARRGWRALQASERRRAALAAFASEGCTCQNPAPGELRGRAKRPGACPQAAAPGSNPPPSTSAKSQHQV